MFKWFWTIFSLGAPEIGVMTYLLTIVSFGGPGLNITISDHNFIFCFA